MQLTRATTLAVEDGRALARYARAVIASTLGGPRPTPPTLAQGDELAATFVTLRRGPRLHGCMGSLSPRTTLLEDVAHNASAAAFLDPRATSLTLADVPALDVEVTVLGPLAPIAARDEEQAVAALRPGVDGVVVAWHGHRGTLLPQVWDELREPRAFLAHVKLKAGLPEGFWAPDLQVFRYEAQRFDDPPGADAA